MTQCIRRTFLAIALILQASLAAAGPWPERDSARIYIFGNSLITHLSDTQETTVPHWLGIMAKAEGRKLALDGRWGFPRNFLPPIDNWAFAEVDRAWYQDRPFATGKFDTIILNTENFIQYNLADVPYLGDNPDQATPLGATLKVFDWVEQNTDTLPRFFIYEGWEGLGDVSKVFPPPPEVMPQYHAHAQGSYAAWYDDYVAKLAASRPQMDIRLIPVGRIMSRLLSEEPLSQIPPEALYSDLSPHGRETTYLLAAMITYAAVFGARPPEGLQLPDSIDTVFATAYEATADRIWDIMQTGAN